MFKKLCKIWLKSSIFLRKEMFTQLQKVNLFYIGYLDFVLFYKDLIMKIRDKITLSKNKLSNGLGKLFEAN
jgi:hypothetical protein